MSYLLNQELQLRAPEPEDLDFLYQWENHSDWWHLGATLSPYSHYALKKYIAEANQDIYTTRQLRLMVDLKTQDKTIGMVDLYDFDPYHRRAGMAVLMDPAYHQQGFGKQAVEMMIQYAFGFLNLHQLYVHIPVENIPSIKLFTGCGFRETGKLTDWLLVTDESDGGYMDVQVMQLKSDKL